MKIGSKEHNSIITGSKVGAIIGVNEYCSAYTMFARMKGVELWPEQTMKMRAGQYAEEMIEKWCKEEWGWDVQRPPEAFKTHPNYNFLGGSVDRLRKDQNGKFDAILEFKNVSRSWEVVPSYYEAQCRFYSILWDLPAILVACFGGCDFQSFEIPRDKTIEKFLLDKCLAFWENLQADIWPEPNASRETYTSIKARYPTHTDALTKEGNADLQNIFDKYIHYAGMEKKDAEAKQLYQNKLCNALGYHEQMVFPDGSSFSWKKTKDRKKFDSKTFEIEHTDLYQKYLTTTEGARVFRTKEAKK